MKDKNYIPVLDAAQMRACDEHTITDLNIPSQVLMERAARAVANRVLGIIKEHSTPSVLVFCGNGNNGGDGFAAARFLTDECIDVTVCYVGATMSSGLPDLSGMSVECARQAELCQVKGIKIITPDMTDDAYIASFSCVVDAIFGIGLKRKIEGSIADVISKINGVCKTVVAVDIPSGINADTGEMCGIAVMASETICIQALKTGLLVSDGARFVGNITVCDIGIDLSPATGSEAARIFLPERLPAFLSRKRFSNKGSYGRILLVCGSRGMSGAAYLASAAALRSGSGLANIFTPEENRIILQTQLPEAIISTYPCDDERATLSSLQNASDTACGIVAGCGIGKSHISFRILQRLLNHNTEAPMILDADALNIISDESQLLLSERFKTFDGNGNRPVTVITPHPLEFSRLTGKTVGEIKRFPITHAKNYAAEHGVFVVLKEAHTVICSPKGRVYITVCGNSGMAVGGSGDALAGIIGAILPHIPINATDAEVTEAIAAAVYLHAAAGDAAREKYGEVSMLPSDLIDSISTVTKEYFDTRTKLDFI